MPLTSRANDPKKKRMPAATDSTREPLARSGVVAVAILLALAVVAAGLGEALHWLLAGAGTHGLRIALIFVGYDLAVGLVLIPAIVIRLTKDARERRTALPLADDDQPQFSVLVAAYQEEASVVETVRRIAASLSRGSRRAEILVGDDGSTDGTWAALEAAFSLEHTQNPTVALGEIRLPSGAPIPLKALRLPHRGKGATLNALAAVASHAVLVTLDADTWPEPQAIERVADVFVDPRVGSAAGVVMIKNGRDNWLLHHQASEYLKNALVRIGWASLGALDQVPGAFSGIRATLFHEAGGFPVDSLTEDYEVTFRLMRQGVRRRDLPLVVCVSDARVWTEGPSSFGGFIRQRTRWFAGFLSTLFRFRDLIFEPRAGTFGLVRLPLKLIDAVLPWLAFVSLVILVRGGASSIAAVGRASLVLFLVRWLWDLVVYALATMAAPRLGQPDAMRMSSPKPALAWLATATEALTFVWLKHAATFRGFSWAARRVRTWESSRQPSPRKRMAS